MMKQFALTIEQQVHVQEIRTWVFFINKKIIIVEILRDSI